MFPGVLISLSHFQILHILKRPCQGQKHNELTRGNPRESQNLEITAGSLANRSLADLASSEHCGPLWKAIKSLEEGQGKLKGKEMKGGCDKITVKYEIVGNKEGGSRRFKGIKK